MKKNMIFIFLLLMLANVGKIYSQSCPIPTPIKTADAIGTWNRTLTMDGELKPFTLQIKMEGKELVTSLNIPSVIKKAIMIDTRICESEEFHIALTVDRTKYELQGKPKGGNMSGNLVADYNNSTRELFVLKKQS